MTTISEHEFSQEVVGPYLRDRFGDDAVERERWLADTTAYADWWVDLDLVTLAIEVENDAGSVRNGVAQALEYAQNDHRAIPVVITPVGQVNSNQVDRLRNICPIVELPVADHTNGQEK